MTTPEHSIEVPGDTADESAAACFGIELMDAIDLASDQGQMTWLTVAGGESKPRRIAAIVPVDVAEHAEKMFCFPQPRAAAYTSRLRWPDPLNPDAWLYCSAGIRIRAVHMSPYERWYEHEGGTRCHHVGEFQVRP